MTAPGPTATGSLPELLEQIITAHPGADLVLAARTTHANVEAIGPQASGFNRQLARDLRNAADLLAEEATRRRLGGSAPGPV